MRIIKRILLIVLISLTLLFSIVISLLYFKKDAVIDQLITEINKNINTPIEVHQVDLNWWTDFPNIALTFNKVTIKDSYKQKKGNLAELEKIALSFDFFNLLQNEYQLNNILLSKGNVAIKINKDGIPNYLIVNQKSSGGSSTVQFALQNITLDSVAVDYHDYSLNQHYDLMAKNADASLESDSNRYEINLTGNLHSKGITSKDFTYFKNKSISVETNLLYDDNTKRLNIRPSLLKVNEESFSVEGWYDINDNLLEINAEGNNSTIQTLLSLLPDDYKKRLEQYRSDGKASFKARINGYMTERKNPSVYLTFSITKGSFFHPDYNAKLNDISLEGAFSNGKQHNLTTSALTIEAFSAKLSGNEIAGKLNLYRLNRPGITLSIEGEANTEDLIAFLPKRDEFTNLRGSISFNLQLSGLISDFTSKTKLGSLSNSGEILLNNVGLLYKPYPLPFEEVSGRLLFNKNDVAVNRLGGFIGESDIQLNGFFLNVFPYLFSDEERLLVEAQTNSQYINLNELLSGLSNKANTLAEQRESFKFSISPFIQLELESEIEAIDFKRFKASKVSGEIIVKDQRLSANQLNFDNNGGSVALNGVVNAQHPNYIQVITDAHFKSLNIDDVFYTFENFEQDFLTNQHLKGKITADVLANLRLTTDLDFIPESLLADINASVVDGALNNFDPMLSLSEYVKEEDLKNLTFGELKNSIHIEDEKIYLPEMVISSNVTNMLLQGTHTFDQRIDYRILLPLKNYKKTDKDAAFGAIEETGDYTNLHLKLVGTTDDFEVSWDGKRSLKAFGDRILKEGRELKELFKKDKETNKIKKIEVDEDEYFDW